MKIADFYNIPIGNAKKSVPNFFDKEKYVPSNENLQLYLRLGLKQKNTLSLRIQSITMTSTICWFTKKWRQRWKSVVQIDEQCYNW